VSAPSEPGWSVADMTASAREIHDTELGTPGEHSMWFLDATGPALVLGSTQPQQGSGIDIVRRRSGGGAVLVGGGVSTWVDLVIPRSSPLWDDDVGRAMHWVGEMWAGALHDLGTEATVHRGPLRHSEWSRTICFAGLGPGEVVDGQGRKIVGVAQRRTRSGARFQTIAYHHDVVARIVGLFGLGVDASRATAELDATTIAADVDPAALRRRLVAHLPQLG
jgi:lipoate---protein ligase